MANTPSDLKRLQSAAPIEKAALGAAAGVRAAEPVGADVSSRASPSYTRVRGALPGDQDAQTINVDLQRQPNGGVDGTITVSEVEHNGKTVLAAQTSDHFTIDPSGRLVADKPEGFVSVGTNSQPATTQKGLTGTPATQKAAGNVLGAIKQRFSPSI
jgi:hypothetical protein